MKVHVTLQSHVREHPEMKSRVLEKMQAAGIQNVNVQRFERYGIVSGDLDSSKLETIRQMPDVKTVEIDEQRQSSDA